MMVAHNILAWLVAQPHEHLLPTMLLIIVLAMAVLNLPNARQLHFRGPRLVEPSSANGKKIPVSVNYHFTRHCNKTCKFCFHTAQDSHKEGLDEAKHGLRLLRDAGMRKVNFAGGEPFLYAPFLGNLLRYCKEELELESCSLVSNGSLIKHDWMAKYGQYLDILAVSCDSFDEQTNIDIGRGSGDNVTKLRQIARWCIEFGIKFKLNTVVCSLNVHEDMAARVAELAPFRWKCFQVLLVPGENDSEKTLRDVRNLLISDENFDSFCKKHEHVPGFVPEPNSVMASSYLILDEYMRFLDKDKNKKSGSILKIGVERALDEVEWDQESFAERGGIYDWTREMSGANEMQGCDGAASNPALSW